MQLHDPAKVRAPLHEASIAVNARQDVINPEQLVLHPVEFLNASHRPGEGIVIYMGAVRYDMTAEKLATMLVGLVVEFLLIQTKPLCGESFPKLRHKCEGISMQMLRNHFHTVIHEQGGSDAALLVQPPHLRIKIEPHSNLAGQAPNGCADSVWLPE